MELNYDRVGDVENITASGTPEEMAAFVLEIQRQRTVTILGRKDTQEDRKKLADTIRAILSEQVQASSSRQQPFPTERTLSQDEELHPDEFDQKSDTLPHL